MMTYRKKPWSARHRCLSGRLGRTAPVCRGWPVTAGSARSGSRRGHRAGAAVQ